VSVRTNFAHLVHIALRVFKLAKKRKSLLVLRGKIEFAPGYDHKALRSSLSGPTGQQNPAQG
jgi:hypothetical protein